MNTIVSPEYQLLNKPLKPSMFLLNHLTQHFCLSFNIITIFYLAPKILNKAEVSLTSEGEDAIIECDVEGYPKPNVAWVKEDGTSVVGLKRHNVREGNILVVRQVVNYVCFYDAFSTLKHIIL